jgi:hypothetical protein
MKHLRKFEKYTTERKQLEIIKESVLQVNDIYKVRTFVEIPQSLINSYVKKVKDTAGKNLRQIFGDIDIAEEIVKYVNTNYTNIDKLPAEALMGGKDSQEKTEEPTQDSTEDTSTETETSTEETPEAEVKVETGTPTEEIPTEEIPTEEIPTEETPTEEKSDDFEEVKEEEKEETNEEGSEELPA